MADKIKCTIVTRTHNHRDLLKQLLSKINIQKKVNISEIIVLDSMSKDGTRDLALENGCKIINIDPKNFTHSNSLNMCAKNSKEEIIIYTSVDIIPKDEYWAYHMIKHFSNKKIAGVFGKQEPIPNFNPIEEFKVKKMFPDDGPSVALFSCASGAIRKSVWDKIHFDENIPYPLFGGQDQTWALDANKLGYKVIYEPKSVVYHSHNYPLRSRVKLSYLDGFYEKEASEFNKNVKMIKYKKIDIVLYLLKNMHIKKLVYDLIICGILVRIFKIRGRADRKSNKKSRY